jgi:hypothetical protein
MMGMVILYTNKFTKFSSLFLIQFCISRINFIKYLTLNHDIYIFYMSYIVHYHLATFI